MKKVELQWQKSKEKKKEKKNKYEDASSGSLRFHIVSY